MARNRQEFALVGYSEELERKPLKFVEPIPPSRICSACGNIPRLMYTLVCGHTYCEPCYESCATTSRCVCPLDGDVCDADDVSSKKYPAENLLRRKVHCLNEAHGCSAILPAAEVAKHVRRDCQHHVTRCPTCLTVVLSRDVCAHLKSRCTSLVLDPAPEPQQGTDNNENTRLVAFERTVEQRVRQLDAKLAQLSSESGSQNDKLVEICHNINHLKEALTEELRTVSVQTLTRLDRNEADMRAIIAHGKTIKQRVGELDSTLAQLSLESVSERDKLIEVCRDINHLKEAQTEHFQQASVQTLERLDRNAAEMKALYKEQGKSLTTAITSVLTSVPRDPKTHQRVITGYAALKKEALKKGWSWSMSDKVYLRRYLMSWGIYFIKDCDSVYPSLCIQLHEGREDDFLDWPFSKEMKLSIIHPDTRQERHLCVKGYSSEANKERYSRPIECSNRATLLTTKVETSDIECDGYVKGDKLLLRFEVL